MPARRLRHTLLPTKGAEMRDYRMKAAREEFVSDWYRTVAKWQQELRKEQS